MASTDADAWADGFETADQLRSEIAALIRATGRRASRLPHRFSVEPRGGERTDR